METNRSQTPMSQTARASFASDTGIQLAEIESGLVQSMMDSSAKLVIDQISECHRKVRLSRVFSLPFLAAGAVAFFTLPSGAKRVVATHSTSPHIDNLHTTVGETGFPQIGSMHWGVIAVLAIGLLGWLVGRRIDSHRRVAVLFYDFDPSVLKYFENFVAIFQRICGCDGVWHLQSYGKIDTLTEWKRNAGASGLITRKKISGRLGLPSVLKCNIDVPVFPFRNKAMYFFPDFVLMVDGKNVGGISYENLKTDVDQSGFIETGRLPRDTEVISHTWLHPNKKGGPDKRFASNRQYPVCAYESMMFESSSGVREQIQYSKRGLGKEFNNALDYLCFANDPASKATTTA